MSGELPRPRPPGGGRLRRGRRAGGGRALGEGADAHRLVEEARGGDEAACAALGRIGHYLGVAIGSFANVFAPDLVVVGGGFGTAAWELLRGPADQAARAEALRPADDGLRIVEAALGDDAGLVGAGLVGFETLDGLR